MAWVIVKHPIIAAGAMDAHQITVPQVPPVPPPSGAPVPMFPHTVPYVHPGMEWFSGKWTDASIAAEGMGICLWGHDWGLTQVHLTAPISPWLAILLAGTCNKLQLPCSSVKDHATGGIIAAGDEAQGAPCFACGFILTQTCWDTSGVSYALPTGYHWSAPSTVAVDVKLGDLFAAVFALGADSLRGIAGGKFGALFGRFGQPAEKVIGLLLGASMRTHAASTLLGFIWTVLGPGTQSLLPHGATITNAMRAEAAAAGRLAGQGLQGVGYSAGAIALDAMASGVQGTGPSI